MILVSVCRLLRLKLAMGAGAPLAARTRHVVGFPQQMLDQPSDMGWWVGCGEEPRHRYHIPAYVWAAIERPLDGYGRLERPPRFAVFPFEVLDMPSRNEDPERE